MRYIIVFLFVTLFLGQITLSQNSKFIIKGKIDIAQNGDVVQLSKPIQRRFNIFYVDGNDDCFIENRMFTKELYLSENSFVRIQSKGLPKFMCYVDRGEVIDFEVITDSVSKNQMVIFHGTNARGNDLLVNRKLLNNGGDDQNTIVNVIKNSSSSSQAMDSLHFILSPYKTLLNDLYVKNEITETCLANLMAETEQRLLFWTMGIISDGFKNAQELRMNKKELLQLTEQLFEEFDPFAKKYESSIVVSNTAAFKCYLIKEKKLPISNSKPQRVWEKYKEYFGMVDSEFGIYDYAPLNQQEFLIGNAMMIALVFKPMSNENFVRVFKTYRDLFPDSPYNATIVNELLGTIDVSAESDQNKNQLLRLDAQGRIIKFDIKEYSDIDQVIKENFSGKNVFVDYWATYCAPCVAEFKHKELLTIFLKENDIEMLYVSLDNEGSKENWKDFIKNYKLYGYHFLTNKSMKDVLNTQFSGIPRYMIYNKKGEVIENNAYRPSLYEKLVKQIKNKIIE
ncbi:hypothetical protein BZG01_19920 [Labilibaculum manganireducens]|uniref:Thioredoxin domain-containing protein n=1 Tax=Labilibaculum manganireducens TaxID=1940525 RepID=A0A2N3HSZ8_9BACT|nr:TlpA disulfide reductase family protein [Labilibaculum manganireducens]PKQ61167.1 hypothetical protein BZG01_19920 [Labilibaculum manganireducens]